MDFRQYMRNPWNSSPYSHPLHQRSYMGVPVEPVPVQPQPTPPPQVMKPRIVSIPVHFAGSGRGRSDSAVKIQKFFRGYLVRINMKKIKAIWKEVNEIARMVSKEESVDLIRNDSRERLKVNEMLMSLLFRLDSVRGVDSGVRDCRKFVIKKVIALQELVDGIASGDRKMDSDNSNESPNQGIPVSGDDCNHDAIITNSAEFVIPQNQEPSEPSEEITVADQRQETDRTESQTDSSANPENLGDDHEATAASPVLDENWKEGNNQESKELLERMMVDNEKMMGLMAELVERNEKQTRLLSALTQRVEHLEKAFLCDKLRRKKRSSVEKSYDGKKCGKR